MLLCRYGPPEPYFRMSTFTVCCNELNKKTKCYRYIDNRWDFRCYRVTSGGYIFNKQMASVFLRCTTKDVPETIGNIHYLCK